MGKGKVAKSNLFCGALVTNEVRLYEIVALTSLEAYLVNVVTDITTPWPRTEVETWRIIMPQCPDTADSLLCDGA